MDDLISRAAALKALAEAMPSLTTPDGCGEFDHDIYVTDEAYVDCMQIIHELPSAEPEIVRCKDCKKYDMHDHRCKHWNHGVVVMDWCSKAERRQA